MYVPPELAVHMPQYATVVDAGTLMTTWLPVDTPAEGAPHVVATRTYAPPLISFAPEVPGEAECSEMNLALF
jgi:hypothetical protein